MGDQRTLSFIPPVGDLQTASSLPLDDNLALPPAQFDLANVPAPSAFQIERSGLVIGVRASTSEMQAVHLNLGVRYRC
jgi:hypothetical protein